MLREFINFIAVPFELLYLKKILKKQKLPKKKLNEIKEFLSDVIVVAPHSDDETLGLGGLIISMAEKIKFHIYIPTIKSEKDDSRRFFESKSAFLSSEKNVEIISGGLSDGKLEDNSEKLKNDLKNLIISKSAKTVFAPLPTELHKDHSACTMSVLELFNEEVFEELYFFSTNHLFLPEMINCYYVFPGGICAKLKMLENYKSQKKINFHKIVEVEKIYSELLDCKMFSELFFKLEREEKNEKERLIVCLKEMQRGISKESYGSISKVLGIIRFAKKNVLIIKMFFG